MNAKNLSVQLLAGSSQKLTFLLKLFAALGGLSLLGLFYACLKYRQQALAKKQEESSKLKDIETKARIILKELEIEASLSVNIAYLKYSERQLTKKERKRQKLIKEFEEAVLAYLVGRFGLSLEVFK